MTSSMFPYEISSSESDEEDQRPVQRAKYRYVFYAGDDMDIERVFKSKKEKIIEQMQDIINNFYKRKLIDMSNILIDFESLIKIHEKSIKLHIYDTAPPFFIRFIADLEDFVNSCWEQREELNRVAKSLTALRQRVQKYNRDFEEQIKDYKEHPENYEEEEILYYVDDVESEEVVTPSELASTVILDEESESGSFLDSDTFRSSSLEASGEQLKYVPAAYFSKTKKKEKVKPKEKPSKVSVKLVGDEEGASTTVDTLGHIEEPQIQAFEKGLEITFEVVKKKLTEIMSNRGKKGTSSTELITLLTQVEDKIKELQLSVGLHAKTLFCLIDVILDYDKNKSCMSASNFNRLIDTFASLLNLLSPNDLELLAPDSSTDELEHLENPPFAVRGSVYDILTLLHSECAKILRFANDHELESLSVCVTNDVLAPFWID